MNNEVLPVAVKEKQMMAAKRNKQRNINGIKRIGKIAVNAGLVVAGIGTMSMGGIVGTIGAGVYFFAGINTVKNILFKEAGKDSMFVLQKKHGELVIGQDSTKIKQAQKIKNLAPNEKAAMMGLGMLVSLRNIQQEYEDKEVQTDPARNGENNVYPQVYSTITHGDNIRTLEALETLGYIQIERKDFKKKSVFITERLGVGEVESAKQAFLAQFNNEEKKKYEHDFYNIAIKITDKKLNVEELAQKYINIDTIDKSRRTERKALKSIGLIFKALKNQNIDIGVNEIGENQIVYNSEQSFFNRVEKESFDKNEEYRKKMYIGDKIEPIEQTVQALEQSEQEKTSIQEQQAER